MTIALGLVSSEFLVLAADTQESWGFVKKRADKIFTGTLTGRGGLRGRIAITGAGGTHYLAYLRDRIARAIQGVAQADAFIDEAEKVIAAEMLEFHHNHWWPLAHLESHRGLEPSLIIGVVLGDARRLWRTHEGTVKPSSFGYETVGAGESWAGSVLDSTVHGLSDEQAAIMTACYSVFVAKERAEYCGSETHVASISNESRGGNKGPSLRWADQDAIRAAEDVFRKYAKLQTAMLDVFVLSTKDMLDLSADRRLSEIRAELYAIDFFPTKRPRGTGRR